MALEYVLTLRTRTSTGYRLVGQQSAALRPSLPIACLNRHMRKAAQRALVMFNKRMPCASLSCVMLSAAAGLSVLSLI